MPLSPGAVKAGYASGLASPSSVSFTGSTIPTAPPGLSPQILALLAQQQQAGMPQKPVQPKPDRWAGLMAAYGMGQPQQPPR